MAKITKECDLHVPDNPTICYIQGDGIGVDITPVMRKVVDAAVEQAYPNRKIDWKEILAGEKAAQAFGEGNELPQESIDAIREHLITIKGPLTTPKGKGRRSLNVALRQQLDLYACVRPVRYFQGVPSPVKEPERVNMVIFRENTEDIYAGIDWNPATEEGKNKIEWFLEGLKERFPGDYQRIRFPASIGLGIKPVSRKGSARLVRAAIEYALANGRKSITLVAKSNIMKYTEGLFIDEGYKVVEENRIPDTKHEGKRGKDLTIVRGNQRIEIKDVIADAFLQQILLRPQEYDVIATLNLNGDYISDALAAQVGGIGIAPGANINDETGIAIFEATHGTAPKYAGLDKLNPSSLILSAVLMLEYVGWQEAADLITRGLEEAIKAKVVTYDFARLMDGATEVGTSDFGDEIIKHMSKP